MDASVSLLLPWHIPTRLIATWYQFWLERGVTFLHPPKQEPAGAAIFTSFEDPDGNSFLLAGVDQITQEIENQRRQAAEKLQSERRTAHEMEIATQVQARLFPEKLPSLGPWNIAVFVSKLATLAEITTIFWISVANGLG